MMTPEEFAKSMERIAKTSGYDTEICHIEMDDLMCMLLEDLVYGKGVEVFNKTNKWYA